MMIADQRRSEEATAGHHSGGAAAQGGVCRDVADDVALGLRGRCVEGNSVALDALQDVQGRVVYHATRQDFWRRHGNSVLVYAATWLRDTFSLSQASASGT